MTVTDKQKANLKPFKKGNDPRRNIKGVPEDAIEARKFIREIGKQLVEIKDEKQRKAYVTRMEKMIMDMFASRNPLDKQNILKASYSGLLKDELDVTSNGKTITVTIGNDATTDTE